MGLDSGVSLWSTRAARIWMYRQLRFLRCHWLGHDPGQQVSFEKAISASDPHRPYLPGLSHRLHLAAGNSNEPCGSRGAYPLWSNTSADSIQVSDKDIESAFRVETRQCQIDDRLIMTLLRQLHDGFFENEVGRVDQLVVPACSGLGLGRRLLWICF